MEKKQFITNRFKTILQETFEDKANQMLEKIEKYGEAPFSKPGNQFDYVQEREVCEKCGGYKGGEVMEREMCECGSMKEEKEICSECGGYKSGSMMEREMCECGSMNEELKGKQKKLDVAKPYGKLTRADFDHLRKGVKKHMKKTDMDEGETEESKEFAYAAMMAKKKGDSTFKLNGKTFDVKGKSKSKVEETLYRITSEGNSELFTENEIIDLIENIVNEEKVKNNIKLGTIPKGMSEYERVHKKDKSNEDQYFKDLAKKMSDYTKTGSKEKFTFEPEHFPKGNGELEKMSKKAYVMSDDGKEFLDNFMRPGMEDLVPEEITYDEDWVNDNIEGSSRTGNNPEWANAVKTDLGEKLAQKLKDKKFRKAKEMAYRKSKQPVTDGTGENSGNGVNIKLESVVDKKTEKLNEEFNRMKSLMGYNHKTQ
jgi:hypothetical protein